MSYKDEVEEIIDNLYDAHQKAGILIGDLEDEIGHSHKKLSNRLDDLIRALDQTIHKLEQAASEIEDEESLDEED